MKVSDEIRSFLETPEEAWVRAYAEAIDRAYAPRGGLDLEAQVRLCGAVVQLRSQLQMMALILEGALMPVEVKGADGERTVVLQVISPEKMRRSGFSPPGDNGSPSRAGL